MHSERRVLAAGVGLLAILPCLFAACRTPVSEATYVIPDEYEGYVWIEHGRAGAMPLEKDVDGRFEVRIPSTGHLRTSNAPFVGRWRTTYRLASGTSVPEIDDETANAHYGVKRSEEKFVCCAGNALADGQRIYGYFYIGHGPVDEVPALPRD